MAEKDMDGALGAIANIDSSGAVRGSKEYVSALNDMEKATDKAGQSIEKVEDTIDRIGESVRDTSKSFSSLEEAAEYAKKLQQRIEALDSDIENFKNIQANLTLNADVEGAETYAKKVSEAVEESIKLGEELEATQSAIAEMSAAMEAQNQAAEKSVSLTKEQEDAFAKIKDVVRDYSQTAAHLIALTSGENKGLISEEDAKKAEKTISAINRLKDEFDRLASLKSSPEEFAKGLEEMKEVIKKITSDDSMNAFLEEISEQKRNITEETEKNNEESGKGADKEKEAQTTIRAELRKTITEIMALNYALSQMNDEQLSSDAAEEMKERLAELTEQASQMTRALKDSNEAVKGMSSESLAFDAISQGLDTAISGFGGLIAAQGVFSDDQEELIEIQTKLQSVLTASNAIKTVQMNLRKQSSLMRGIETAQTYAAAAAENVKTMAEGKGVVVTKLATLAQAAFNAVAKANPYVLLATAILTVVGAVSAYVIGTKKAREEEKKRQDEQKKAAEAQKVLAEKQKEIASAAAKTSTDFARLQTQWKNLKTTAEKKQWIDDNKSAFEALGITINSINTAEKVFESQTKLFAQAMVARAIATAKAAQAGEEYMNFIKNKPSTVRKFGNVKGGDSYGKLSQEEKSELTKKGYTGNAGRLSDEAAEYITNRRREKAEQASIQANKDNAKKEKELLDSYIKATEEEIKVANALSSLGDKKTKNTGKDDVAKNAQKLIDTQTKADKEAQRARIDNALATEQYIIDAYAEGAKKRRLQIELDNKKEIEAIERAKEDAVAAHEQAARELWEAQNPNADKKGHTWENTGKKGRTFDLTDDEKEMFKAREDAAKASYEQRIKDELQADLQYMRDYLKEYGTFQEQRLAIAEEYDEKIAKLRAGGASEAQIGIVEEQKKDAIKKVDEKENLEIFNEIDWEGIFGNLEGHTQEYLKTLRDQLRELLESNKLSDIADIEKVQQKISELNAYIANKGGLFSFSGAYTDEQQRLKENRDNARANLGRATASYAKAGANVETLKMQGKQGTAQMVKAEAELEKARAKVAAATAKAKQADDALNKTLADQVAGVFKTIQESKIFENLEQLPDLFGKLGMGDAAEKTQKGLDGFNDVAGAAADYAQGNYIGAAMKGISAVQNFGEALGAWSNSNRADVEAVNHKLEIAMGVNTEAINKLTDAMERQNPEQAYKSYEQAVAMLKQNEQAENLKMRNNSTMYDGGHSLNDDLLTAGGTINKIYAKLGKKSSNGYYHIYDLIRDFSASELSKLYEDEEGRKLLKELGEKISAAEDDGNYNGLFQDLLKYIGTYSEESFKDLAKKFQASVTSVSFDTLYDNFVSSLMDMDKSAEDFANDFEGYLRNAIYQAMVAKKVKPLLENWMGAFANAMKSKEANGQYLSKEEINQLMKSGGHYVDENGNQVFYEGYEAIIEVGKTLRDGIEELGLYNGKNDQNQEATANGIKSITADQADQLVGRITAMQIAVEAIHANQADTLTHIKESTSLVQGDVSTIKGYIEEQNGYISEIVDIQYESNRYLHDITKHTSHLVTIAEDINKIKEDIKRL